VVHAARRKGKGRPRILYWFRTPPGVRVGRGPLDEEAIRLIEAGNPELEFDWTRILKGDGPADRQMPERREQRRDRPPRPSVEAERRVSTTEPVPAQLEPPPPPVEEPMTAAHARLGSEGLARLRGRYSEMLARIGERIAEQEQREELKVLAERLNPDTWVTEADVAAGLESYETTFASLRAALVTRRKPEPPESPV
jgi:hypothetical protein